MMYTYILLSCQQVISCAIEKNETLQYLNLDGNSLGQLGARSVMRAVRLVAAAKRILTVSFENANLSYTARNLFNRSEPSGTYTMNMSDPYDYTIVHLLYEMANLKTASRFKNMQYRSTPSQKWKRITLSRAAHMAALGTIPDLVNSISNGLSGYNPEGSNTTLLDLVDTITYILGFEPHPVVLQNILFHLHSLPVTKWKHMHLVLRTIFKVIFKLGDKHKVTFLDSKGIEAVFSFLQCTSTLWCVLFTS
jgi:hypothetical protein